MEPEKMTNSVFDNLNKRQHVYEYRSDRIPEHEVVDEILRNAWQVTPSKQNLMPYQINVLGPEDLRKRSIYRKVVGNHQMMEEAGVAEGAIAEVSGEINPHYRHVLHNPYLLVFSQRVVPMREVNTFYKRKIAQGHFMEQCSHDWVPQIKASTAIEVGLFAQNIAALCLEKDIDYSFTSCFPGKKEKWKDISFIKEEPLLLMSLGYKKTFRREYMLAERKKLCPDPKDWHTNDDYKVKFVNVVHYE